VQRFALFGTHWCDAVHCYFLVWFYTYGFFYFRVSMSGPIKRQIARSRYLGTPSADIETLMFAVVICKVRVIMSCSYEL
jgi:hypothetical protein